MNAAILNADLPISIRMKRANRRGWMLDRRDNIKFLVHGVQAYRQLAAPLAWELNECVTGLAAGVATMLVPGASLSFAVAGMTP